MPPKQEFLSGGLVTARVPGLLQEGEVQAAEDVLLKPGSLSIFKAPGRTRFNNTALASIDGLAFCAFDNNEDKVVAIAGGSYYITDVAPTGTFSLLSTGAGSTLDSVALGNKTVLLTGVTDKVLLQDESVRTRGLQPVTVTPSLHHDPASGAWPLGATQLGWFEYWTTEVVRVYNAAGAIIDEVESTFTGTPASVNVTMITSKVTVTLPLPLANTNATHWKVYRSNKKATQQDRAFPAGFKIADLAITSTTFDDTAGTATAQYLPTVAGASATTVWDPTKVNFVLLADGQYAEGLLNTANSSTLLSYPLVTSTYNIVASDPIIGFSIEIRGYKTTASGSGPGCSIVMGHGINQTVGLTGAPQTFTYTPTLSQPWFATELANGVFQAEIHINRMLGQGTVFIDYIKISVIQGGTVAALTDPFPAIFITAGPATASIGANSPPAVATTGDVFQGSVVTNDIASPTNVVWTIPGTIDYSPIIYRNAFDTKEHDRVTCIRALSTVLLVGTESLVHRMNYLPLEDDPEFNTGRAVELVDADDGMVGPNAACKFVYNGELRLFYIGQMFLKMTNGYTAEPATDSIIWSEMHSAGSMRRAVAINNTLYSEIQVIFPSSSGTIKILRLSYHSTHLVRGKLKVVSLTNYAATSGTTGVTNTGDRVYFTGKSDGVVYIENRGVSDASGGGIRPRVVTREFGDIGNTFELDQLGIEHQNNNGAVANVSYTATLTNYPSRTATATPITMDFETTRVITDGETGDSISIELSGEDDDNTWTIDSLILFASEQGETAPLKR